MVSISILGLPGWGNLSAHCQAPLARLCRLGQVWQRTWASLIFYCSVLSDVPVHPRFLVRSRLLTRM
jgi:hypothetical protein